MEEYFIDEFGVHFSKDRQTLIWCPSDFKGEYRIPSGVLSIENGAFTRCEGLLSLKIPFIPEIIRNIDYNCIVKCNTIRTLVVPEGVVSLAYGAISHCSSLESVFLPSTIFSLDEGLFSGCPNLKTVIIPPGTKAKFLQMGLDFLKDKLIFSQVE